MVSGFKTILVAVLGVWVVQAGASGTPTNSLVAYYPLRKNGDDSVGTNSALVLTNAPFRQGAVYVNGYYEANGHFVNYLATAPLQALDYASFTISLDFCPEPLGLRRRTLTRPEWFLDELTRGSYSKWAGYSNHDEQWAPLVILLAILALVIGFVVLSIRLRRQCPIPKDGADGGTRPEH